MKRIYLKPAQLVVSLGCNDSVLTSTSPNSLQYVFDQDKYSDTTQESLVREQATNLQNLWDEEW